ncbi:MAG: histidine ammonia-lyase [Lentimicrobium sp.]|jgi:histidine ammonia-lyase|nr:histidine ammonia-lyase [Lentimicrobium sp.]MDD2528935.1 histidine ammonia-lyase [Lentimicrobiaceae bacterium]MDD4598833.1 histidine ammonia-lyase [Lentimicrobiaceae bacterium]MDY0026428.1 histidine ammonia-lyase [Lentimicrobium sp.]
MKTFSISSQPIDFNIIGQIIAQDMKLVLSEEARQKIQHCRNYLDDKLTNHSDPIYGITTGFGSLCNISIPADDLTRLQENLVMSHACGTGTEVDSQIVKLMLLLKIYALSLGNSGVQVQTVERLIEFFNHDLLPVVYEQGSLGASGDLAPLAHLSLPLLGLGEMRMEGKTVHTKKVLKKFGWSPITLQSKEGLALLNGTQFMSAHGVYILLKAQKLARMADITGALSLEAYNGRIDPFMAQLHAIRPHRGQVETARNFRNLLHGSKLIDSPGKKVQDPYSFRCIPQVHGAVKDTINYVSSVLLTEINAVTDNPTIFPDEDLVLSGGNFHGEPLAFALDFLAIALAELGNISERRVYRLISGQRGLPEFLVARPGLNSGFMIPQYTAASIVSQNKQLATPCSVDSITSSNEQEDHVSMGANAATKTLKIVENLQQILGIELFAAAQALEFRGTDLTSPFLNALLSEYRGVVPFIEEDQVMYPHLSASSDFIDRVAFDFPETETE